MARSSTSFAKGVSGNVRGRPRLGGRPPSAVELGEIRTLCRQHGPACVSKLAEMGGLVSGVKAANNESARIAAIIALLDRGFGKSAQTISGDTNAPLLIDFRWADTTAVVPAQPAQLIIEAAAEPDAEAGDVEARPGLRDLTGSLPDPDRC
jgi:hypothetical protein